MSNQQQVDTYPPGGGLLDLAKHGVIWSIVQNWGGKLLAFGLSILLARLLSPAEFGIASAAALILMLIPMIAEYGFGDAILQRQNLKREELNLPFYLSVSAAAMMVFASMVFSDRIAMWLEVPGLSFYIVAVAATILINAPSAFQEAMYKRNLKFRTLAFRTFLTNLCGGTVAVAFAWYGFGIWSFVVSAYVSSLINMLWLWWTPEWKPSLKIEVPAFVQLARFATPVVGQRLMDFAGSRFIDVLIISQFSLAMYGIYVVGARLYQTMMQLLQGAFSDVSLTVLSRIASDRQRMAEAYLKTIGLSASYIAPVFVLVAVLSPEICSVLYGAKWQGVDLVATALLMLGAVQCVQYMNGPFLSARGRPELIFLAGAAKTIATILFLLFIPARTLEGLALLFAAGQLVATPFTFFFVLRELNLPLARLIKTLYPAVINGIVCVVAVSSARPLIETHEFHPFWQGIILGLIYALCWLMTIAVLDRARLAAVLGRIIDKIKSSRTINETAAGK